MTRRERRRWHRATPTLLASAGLLLAACVTRPVDDPGGGAGLTDRKAFPQSLEKDVDILFVVDSSESMLGEQQTLKANFPVLIEALRSDKLGADDSGRPCTSTDRSGCQIPNVHIGVISPDLGAGPYPLGRPATEDKPEVAFCEPGGDGGRLQSAPRESGCIPPSDPWISLIEGTTNVPSGDSDPIERVKDAFSCIAALGAGGCGFEQQLEATRVALDPQLGTNPGFTRPDALLAVVFITDEDDCSAARTEFMEPANTTFGPPQGANYRCFQLGITCANLPPDQAGEREGCAPASSDWLHPVAGVGGNRSSYSDFLKGLKGAHRVVIAAIAGPDEPVRVESVTDSNNVTFLALQPSCASGSDPVTSGGAFPSIRIKALTDSFDSSRGEIEAQYTSICENDFGPAMAGLGERILGALGRQCVSAPLFTKDGGLACHAGDDLGGGETCPTPGCLDQTDCTVLEQVGQVETKVDACPAALFNDLGTSDCGTTCPCWRIVPNGRCNPTDDGSPYAFEILRVGEAEKGTVAFAECRISTEDWGSPGLFSSLDNDDDGIPDRICQ